MLFSTTLRFTFEFTTLELLALLFCRVLPLTYELLTFESTKVTLSTVELEIVELLTLELLTSELCTKNAPTVALRLLLVSFASTV